MPILTQGKQKSLNYLKLKVPLLREYQERHNQCLKMFVKQLHNLFSTCRDKTYLFKSSLKGELFEYKLKDPGSNPTPDNDQFRKHGPVSSLLSSQ